ncbi:hypothetical protein ABS764_04155 [Flavobacterium sp. ST-87]|uniref:DUF2798 domain-containing protein n=1 Tax=Flavobacterium plantiphilum TaxID=3163297 RepID=A0ABW8XR64_9FLAO
MKFSFLKPTLISCGIGIFIPGFTAILFFLFQLLTDKLNIECEIYWKSLWVLTTLTAVATPIIFIKNIEKTKNPTLTKLTIFNFVEYISLQASLAQFFTNVNTICYGSGGQNGIELVFTAWLALPILICFSFLFKFKFGKFDTKSFKSI